MQSDIDTIESTEVDTPANNQGDSNDDEETESEEGIVETVETFLSSIGGKLDDWMRPSDSQESTSKEHHGFEQIVSPDVLS